ncbi:MAG: PrgI family protein [bacterium]|nr:PrgI family protein [bacterium]
MPQFKVPQNIDMEDRIIGKFTLKQFGYLAVGGTIAYIALNKLPSPLNIIIGGLLGIMAFAMAVIKIQDKPLPEFLVGLIIYLFKPRERRWKHEAAAGVLINKDRAVKKSDQVVTKKQYSKAELEKVSELVDSHGYSKLEDE